MSSTWPQLDEFCEQAAERWGLKVWLFGSALRSTEPKDLDVLVMYDLRQEVVRLRSSRKWHHYEPPLHVIAMTPLEEQFYNFIAVTNAVRLV